MFVCLFCLFVCLFVCLFAISVMRITCMCCVIVVFCYMSPHVQCVGCIARNEVCGSVA